MDKEEFLLEDYENGELEAEKSLKDEAKNDESGTHVAASEIIAEWSDPELRKQVEDRTEQEQEVALEDLEALANSPPDSVLNTFEQLPEVQDEMNEMKASVGDQDVHAAAEQSPIIEEPPSRVQSEERVSESEEHVGENEERVGESEEITITEIGGSKDLDVEVENDELLTCPVIFHLQGQDPIALVGENAILAEAPDYLLTLDRVFGLLRERIDTQEGLEIVLQITDLDLVINEDNIYAGETRISDLIEVLDVVPKTPDHLDITVTFQPRFVFGLNSLFEKLHAPPPTKKAKR